MASRRGLLCPNCRNAVIVRMRAGTSRRRPAVQELPGGLSNTRASWQSLARIDERGGCDVRPGKALVTRIRELAQLVRASASFDGGEIPQGGVCRHPHRRALQGAPGTQRGSLSCATRYGMQICTGRHDVGCLSTCLRDASVGAVRLKQKWLFAVNSLFMLALARADCIRDHDAYSIHNHKQKQ